MNDARLKLVMKFLAQEFPEIEGPKNAMTSQWSCWACMPRPTACDYSEWEPYRFNPGCQYCWQHLLEKPKLLKRVLAHGIASINTESAIDSEEWPKVRR